MWVLVCIYIGFLWVVLCMGTYENEPVLCLHGVGS